MISRRSLARLAATTRLIAAGVAGVAALLVTGVIGGWRYAPLVGWDVAALAFTLMVWLAVGHMNAETTATHTTREDPGRTTSDVIVLVAAVASLAAVGVALAQPAHASQAQQNLAAALGFASLALSWATVHTLYMLRYARSYYVDEPGGIDFNSPERPTYVDFAYVAFTVGMTFQISDTAVSSPTIRASVLRHALLSYLFGAVILAAAINLVVGIASSG